MRITAFILSLLAAVCTGYSAEQYSFKQLSVSDGLHDKTVTALAQDSQGFIWTGTINGLSRYDGYRFKNFLPRQGDSLSIHGLNIARIVAGQDRLWVLTEAGLELYNPADESFRLIKFSQQELLGSILFISADDEGRLWVYGGGKRFTIISFRNGQLEKDLFDLPDAVVQDSVFKLHNITVTGDTIWMACNTGIICYDYHSGASHVVARFDQPDYCHSMSLYKADELVVPYFYSGVYTIDLKTMGVKHIGHPFLFGTEHSQTITSGALKLSDSLYWVISSHGLFNIIGTEVNYYNKSSDEYIFEGEMPSCMITDNQQNVWLGTFESGMFRINSRSRDVQSLTKLHGDEKTGVISMQYFSNGTLLFCNQNMCYYAKDDASLKSGNTRRIHNGLMTSLHAIDSLHCMLISNDSLYLYNASTEKLRFQFKTASAQCAIKTADIIWYGTWSNGMKGQNLKTNEQYHIPISKDANLNNSVFTIIADQDGSLWLGSYGSGLVHITDPTSAAPAVTKYQIVAGKNSIGSNIVNCLYDDGKAHIWIGTNGGGLSRFNKQSQQFDNFTIANGLKSDNIESITGDSLGNIWFASQLISKYDIQTEEFIHYTEANGVFGSYFSKSVASAAGGNLYFGSSKGLTIVNPYTSEDEVSIPAPLITGISIFGKEIDPRDTVDGMDILKASIQQSNILELPHSASSFALSFASIQYKYSQNIVYKYMLNGVDQDWVYTNDANTVTYAGLRPGEYRFELAAAFGTAEWSQTTQLYITIVPPWWQSLWFKMLFSLMLIGIIAAFIYSRFRSIRLVNRRLEYEVGEQTKALRQANRRLENRHIQMRENHTVLELKNQQLNDALQAKDRLIRILGHDFINPISALMGTAELLYNRLSESSDNAMKQAEIIMNSSSTLYRQMVSTLDWAISLDNELVANPVPVNIETIVNDALTLVEGSARQKNISLSTNFDFEHTALADPKMLHAILRNLMANAVKYTPRGGVVHVVAQEMEETIEISIVDTGTGIQADLLAKIQTGTEKLGSTRGTEGEKGTGFGLSVVRTYIAKCNGTLEVSSEVGKGSVFTVCLPVDESLAEKVLPEIEIPAELSETETVWPDHVSILIIDDDQEILEIIQELFENRFSVVKAKDGKEGLFLAQKVVPDLIVSDIHLPFENGLELCEKLKNDTVTAHIPVVLISSMNDPDVENKAYLHGANDFIRKPFNLFAFRQKIIALIEYKHISKQNSLEEYVNNQGAELPLDYDSRITKEVIDYVISNVSNPKLRTEKIAEEVGISRSQLWRILKKSSGKTAGDFIRDIRLDKSADMIKTGKYRISEVAYEVGYTDPRYYTKCFAKKFGMNPKEYMAKYAKEE